MHSYQISSGNYFRALVGVRVVHLDVGRTWRAVALSLRHGGSDGEGRERATEWSQTGADIATPKWLYSHTFPC